MGLVNRGIKKYPMCTMKYTAVFLMLWAYISAGGPGHLVQMHGIMDSIKYQQIKNKNLTDSVRNLIMGHVWIFQPDNNPKTNLKNNTKMGHWAQNQASAMAIPVLWPEPCRKWVRWTEERSTVMELWIWRIWSDSGWRNGLWSLVRCSLTSSGIIGENSYTILANGGFKKHWIKGYR